MSSLVSLPSPAAQSQYRVTQALESLCWGRKRNQALGWLSLQCGNQEGQAEALCTHSKAIGTSIFQSLMSLPPL